MTAGSPAAVNQRRAPRALPSQDRRKAIVIG